MLFWNFSYNILTHECQRERCSRCYDIFPRLNTEVHFFAQSELKWALIVYECWGGHHYDEVGAEENQVLGICQI